MLAWWMVPTLLAMMVAPGAAGVHVAALSALVAHRVGAAPAFCWLITVLTVLYPALESVGGFHGHAVLGMSTVGGGAVAWGLSYCRS